MIRALAVAAAAAVALGTICKDVSTNCWSATHGGSKDYCTNSAVCPTCGDYMAEQCRATCAAYIEGCGPTPTPAPGPCVDVSSNCWSATHHGSEEYCTNSAVCPTCGDYMSVQCRKTCARWIEGCKHPEPHPDGDFSDDLAFCYVMNAHYKNPSGSHNKIVTLQDIPTMKACMKKCTGNKNCGYASHQGANGYCYLYVKDMGMVDVPANNGFVSGPTDCDECHSDYGKIDMEPLKTIDDVRNAGKCQKKCAKTDGCAYMSFEDASKTCLLFDSFDSEKVQKADGWVTEKVGCKASARALFFEDVTAAGTAQVTVVAAAMLAVGALGYHAYSKTKSVLKEPLLVEA